MFFSVTSAFRGTNCRLRKAIVPVFVFAVMACASLPASASALTKIRVRVYNDTDQVLHLEAGEVSKVKGWPKGTHVLSDEQIFSVPKHAFVDAPIQGYWTWVAVKCPVGHAFGLVFMDQTWPFSPDVAEASDGTQPHTLTDPYPHHDFKTQWVHYYWRQRVRVYRHDDSGNRVVFGETIFQAPSCE